MTHITVEFLTKLRRQLLEERAKRRKAKKEGKGVKAESSSDEEAKPTEAPKKKLKKVPGLKRAEAEPL